MTKQTLIVYTTEVGGIMQCRWGTWEEYAEIRDSGQVTVDPSADIAFAVPAKMVAFFRLGDLRDFVTEPVESDPTKEEK